MKTHSLFYKIYFSAVALFAVGLTVFLFAFGGWLKAYEAAQPEQIMSAFMNNDVKGGKISAVKDKYHISVSKYETNDSIDKAFTAATKGKELTFATSAIKPEGCDLAYSVKSGDSKLMSVYLKRDSKKRYSISGIDFDKKLYKSYKISATSDAEISVNGVIVEDGDRKNEELPDIDSALTKSGSIINKQIISLDNMLNDEPQITAKSGSTALPVEKNGTVYNVVQEFAEKEAVGKLAGKAASVYAEYMQNDSSMGQIRKYMDTDTKFYKNLRTSLVIFALDHEKHVIKDLKTTDFHKYSDNLFSCRVTLINELTRRGEKYQDKFDKYVYLRRDGDTYKVLDMQNTGDKKDE